MIDDLRMVARSPIIYPRAGQWFTDLAYGQRILRVTDERSGRRCTNAYSYWPALNCDSTWLLLARDDMPWIYQWPTGDSFSLIGEADPELQFEGATWSWTEPNVLKAIGRSGTLYRYNVSRPVGSRATAIKFLGGGAKHLTVSKGGTVYAYMREGKACVYTASDDTEYVFAPKAGASLRAVNEIQIARNGIRAIVTLSDGSVILWDFRRDLQIALPNTTSHWHAGHAVMVNGDGIHTGINARSYNLVRDGAFVELAPVNVLRYLKADGRTVNWKIADHVSLSSDENTVLVSTYGRTVGQPFEHEVVLVNLVTPGFVRLCGTHSTYFPRSATSKGLRYYDEPHATLSQDGRWIVWTANLGNSKRWDVLATSTERCPT